MTKVRLTKIMISCWDFTTEKEFTDTIAFLTVCMYHTENNEKAENIQDVIWYILDKLKNFNKQFTKYSLTNLQKNAIIITQ